MVTETNVKKYNFLSNNHKGQLYLISKLQANEICDGKENEIFLATTGQELKEST